MNHDRPASFAELYREHDAYAQFSQSHWTGGSLPVNFMRVQQDDVETVDPATRTFALGVALGGRAGFEVDFGEGVRTIAPFSQGVYLNATVNDTVYRQRGSHDLLFLDCPLDAIASGIELEVNDLVNALRPLHDQVVLDAAVRSYCLTLWSMRTQHGPFASLAIDHGILTLVAKLASIARPEREARALNETKLTQKEMNRLDAYLSAHLHEPLTAATLAGLTDRQGWRFLQDFKAAAGQTPHQYVLSRRIARAQELLAAGDMPLAEIAYACGFASQSHMTDVFRQKLGVTPGRYRKEVQG